ncbi:MAG: alpha/beta hydrolase [Propionibacteriaceae bacterium]|jgi:acetyl esterase|nr:alpha/beta hydrolase [Propionibacteriaceae bacterium]
MALDPILRPLVTGLTQDLPDIPIEVERAQGLASAEAQVGIAIEPAPANVLVSTLYIPGPTDADPVLVKVHRTPAEPGQGPRPGLVYIHGGGWSTGSALSPEMDATCGWFAANAGVVVVNVEYRLAPENPFPAGFDDCWAALTWVADNADLLGIDPERLGIGGGSAGGNLSAALTLKAKAEGGPALKLQLLEAPVVDLTMSSDSIHIFDEEYPAVAQMAAALPPRYLADPTDATNPYVSPLLAPDLSGLPRAVILTCEIDPVRDEGRRYAERLKEAGVPVEFTQYEGMLHGCWSLTLMLPSARRWRDQCVAALRTL